MSDDVKHSEDDRINGTSGDDVKHGEDGKTADNSGGDQPNEPTPAQKAAEEQKAGLLRKIKAGDLTIDQIKSDKNLAWLAPALEKSLTPNDNVDVRALAQEEARKILAEEREKSELQSLNERINSVPAGVKASIDSTVKLYEEKLGKVEALKLAFKLNGIADDVFDSRQNMNLQFSSGIRPTKRQDDYEAKIINQYDLSGDELAQMMEAKRRAIGR